jgi:hypothetical protein
MNESHERILKPILETFLPKTGKLNHVIHSDRSKGKAIHSFYISLETFNYNYFDPFYGEIEANNPIDEFINVDCDLANIQLSTWKDIEYLNLNGNEGVNGYFSNSLEVVPLNIEFGSIDEKMQIDLSAKYYLTNTDSYPAMKGSKEEHSKYVGKVQVKLQIEPLLFLDKRKIKILPLRKIINSNFYDEKSIREENLWVCEDWYKYYSVNLRKLNHD